MNDTPEIYEAHHDLSACNTAFLDFVKKNPTCLERAHFNKILLDKRFPYFKSQPWPIFVSSKRKKEMSDIAIKISDLIKTIIPRLFSYDVQKISSYFEIAPDVTKRLLFGATDDHIKNLLGRGDFIITPAKEFKCLEFNMQANLGGWQLDILEPMYAEIPVIAKFLKEYNPIIHKSQFFALLFDHVLDVFLKNNPRAGHPGSGIDEINMAIGYPDPFLEFPTDIVGPIQKNYVDVLKQKNPSLKGDIFITALSSMKLMQNYLMLKNRKINILVEMINGPTPFLFMQVVKDGRLAMYNGPITRLMSNKFNLSFLSENQDSDIFTPEEQALIKKYIPWTRKIVNTDIPFLLSNQKTLVLKSAEGLGGEEVFLGCTTSTWEWEQQIKKAMADKRWIVQEYIESACYLFQNGASDCLPHHVIWGIFVFGATPAGGFIRMMPEQEMHGAINTHTGAERTIIIEVEEP